eukprot:2122929-Amphidinium_carterae.1
MNGARDRAPKCFVPAAYAQVVIMLGARLLACVQLHLLALLRWCLLLRLICKFYLMHGGCWLEDASLAAQSQGKTWANMSWSLGP